MTPPISPTRPYVPLMWLVGLLATLAIALGTSAANNIRDDIRDLQSQASEMRQVRGQIEGDHARLERIEEKLDRLLEARR